MNNTALSLKNNELAIKSLSTNDNNNAQTFIGPSVSNTSSIQALGNSLIFDLICDDFTWSILGNCRAVCRAWLSIFNPHYWREIDWLLVSEKNIEDLVLKHSNFIEDLEVGLWHSAAAKDNKLTNLLDLHILHFVEVGGHSRLSVELDKNNFLVSKRKPKLDQHDKTRSSSTLSLIGRNPGLQYLAIDLSEDIFSLLFGSSDSPDYGDARHQDDESILFALKSLPYLKELRIRCYFIGKSKALSVILRHCPSSTLQELTIQGISSRLLSIPDIPDPLSTDLDDDDSWPLFPALEIISVTQQINSTMIRNLIQLIKRSPRLTKLSMNPTKPDHIKALSDTIIEYCPNLKEISTTGGDEPCEDTARLFRSLSCLQNVTCSPSHLQQQDTIVPAILQNSWATLERLYFYGISNVASKTIARVLGECPNLRLLSIPGYAHTCAITLPDFVLTPWASNQIENISLSITTSCWAEPNITQTSLSKQEIVELVAELRNRFYKHHKAINFDIEWPEEFRMPLEEALALGDGRFTEWDTRILRLYLWE